MKCPFELPVEAIEYKDACTRAPLKHKGIEANDGTTLVKLIWPSYANYIVTAINSHEKLLTVAQHLVSSATKYPKDYATKDLNKLIPYLIKEAKQALKEAEKP